MCLSDLCSCSVVNMFNLCVSCLLQLINKNEKIGTYKNGFINLALPFFAFTEPVPAPKKKVTLYRVVATCIDDDCVHSIMIRSLLCGTVLRLMVGRKMDQR